MPLMCEFQLLKLDSRLISVVGRYGPILAESTQIGANRRKSKPSQRESSRVGINPRKKKKKLRHGTNAQATVSRVGLGCDTFPVASILSRSLMICIGWRIHLHQLWKFCTRILLFYERMNIHFQKKKKRKKSKLLKDKRNSIKIYKDYWRCS